MNLKENFAVKKKKKARPKKRMYTLYDSILYKVSENSNYLKLQKTDQWLFGDGKGGYGGTCQRNEALTIKLVLYSFFIVHF